MYLCAKVQSENHCTCMQHENYNRIECVWMNEKLIGKILFYFWQCIGVVLFYLEFVLQTADRPFLSLGWNYESALIICGLYCNAKNETYGKY